MLAGASCAQPTKQSTATMTETTATANKENATSKRKANNSSSKGRTVVVIKPRTKMEELLQRRNSILARTDDSFDRIHDKSIQPALSSVIEDRMKGIDGVVKAFESKVDRMEVQAAKDDKQLSELKQSLRTLVDAKKELQAKIDEMEQELVRLRLEATHLDDQAKETVASKQDLEKRKQKLHHRTLQQMAFFEKVSGIIWNYAEIEKDSNRLVGQMVRVDLWLLLPEEPNSPPPVYSSGNPFETNLSSIRL